MKVVIMAGGRGTRITSVASDIPKPMIRIEGKPVLEHEIECLRRQGFTDIILTVSHLSQIIMDYFGDGSRFGVQIEYYFEKEPLGNAGALFKLKDKLDSNFLLLNADAMFDVDFNRFVAFHKEKGGLVTLFTHPNSHPYDSGLIIADQNGTVEKWLAKEDERPSLLSESRQCRPSCYQSENTGDRTERKQGGFGQTASETAWPEPGRCSAMTVRNMSKIWEHRSVIMQSVKILRLEEYQEKI